MSGLVQWQLLSAPSRLPFMVSQNHSPSQVAWYPSPIQEWWAQSCAGHSHPDVSKGVCTLKVYSGMAFSSMTSCHLPRRLLGPQGDGLQSHGEISCDQSECRDPLPKEQSSLQLSPFKGLISRCSCFQPDQGGRTCNPASNPNQAFPETRLSSPQGPQADLALACQSGFSAVRH